MVIEAVNPTFAGQCPFGSGRCTFLTPSANESSTWGLLCTKAAGSDRRDYYDAIAEHRQVFLLKLWARRSITMMVSTAPTSPTGPDTLRGVVERGAFEEPDHRPRRLLGARREQQRRRTSVDLQDIELAMASQRVSEHPLGVGAVRCPSRVIRPHAQWGGLAELLRHLARARPAP